VVQQARPLQAKVLHVHSVCTPCSAHEETACTVLARNRMHDSTEYCLHEGKDHSSQHPRKVSDEELEDSSQWRSCLHKDAGNEVKIPGVLDF
jgi:hypothetical protein